MYNYQKKYYATDKMSDLICENHSILLVMSRFGISLGFGSKLVDQVCIESEVDTNTFLTVINLLRDGSDPANLDLSLVSIKSLTIYLQNSHKFFLDFRLPNIRRKLIEAIDHGDEISLAIIKFYDKYVAEVKKHMAYEEKKVFPYVEALLSRERSSNYGIELFYKQHTRIDTKLSELKNILIKYYPTKGTNEINSVLFEIFQCAEDLSHHTAVENYLYVPAIEILEKSIDIKNIDSSKLPENNSNKELSIREKEIVCCVVKGMTNKEIAAELYISIHTVMTHRKNIASKLQIHSPAGLTIYALVNKLIDIDQIKGNMVGV